jgi:hypothetical protein
VGNKRVGTELPTPTNYSSRRMEYNRKKTYSSSEDFVSLPVEVADCCCCCCCCCCSSAKARCFLALDFARFFFGDGVPNNSVFGKHNTTRKCNIYIGAVLARLARNLHSPIRSMFKFDLERILTIKTHGSTHSHTPTIGRRRAPGSLDLGRFSTLCFPVLFHFKRSPACRSSIL